MTAGLTREQDLARQVHQLRWENAQLERTLRDCRDEARFLRATVAVLRAVDCGDEELRRRVAELRAARSEYLGGAG